ncbi:hypothetical protein EMWEY_00036370 [Eimeria maxima]|uniref:Uncharacterized protein n=1 Tax=Eimeria maxima TaxID=5804 RepID=U6M9N9_EIMMA|nr:hypothetical protein EMWEY_00036370 [Eimeria maxima]CDJ60932.1 hypothetical protein EMWEY_00036370 [Eimeria maxima]
MCGGAMQVAAATETGSPTSPHPVDLGDSASEVISGNVMLHFASKILRQRQNGEFGRLSFTGATLAAVVAVVAAYLVLRCALHLSITRKSIEAQRFLAEAEFPKSKGKGEPCGAPERGSSGGPPAGADAAAAAVEEEEEEEEAPVLRDLLVRARRYAADLAQLIRKSGRLVVNLDSHLKARCVAEFLCLCVVEFSALFSLLERKERAGIREIISKISSHLFSFRRSFGRGEISHTRFRHIRCVHALLNRLADVRPSAGALQEKQRLVMIKHLLQLQELALAQLSAGIFWLSMSQQMLEKARSKPKGAPAAAEGAAPPTTAVALKNTAETRNRTAAAAAGDSAAAAGDSAAAAAAAGDSAAAAGDCAAATGDSAAAAGGSAASEAAVKAPPSAVSIAASKVISAVVAIELTVHRRREQVLHIPQLSYWLREAHERPFHYGLLSRFRIDRIAQRPLQTHKQQIQTLQDTPLGSGEEPWENARLKRILSRKRGVAKYLPWEALTATRPSPSEGPSSAPGSPGPLTSPGQGPQAEADDDGLALAPLSPSASTGEDTLAEEEEEEEEEEEANVLSSSPFNEEHPRVLPNELTSVPVPVATLLPHSSAFSTSPELAPAPSALDHSPEVTRASTVVDAPSVGRPCESYQFSGPVPRLPPSSFRAPISSSAYSSHASTSSAFDLAAQDPAITAVLGALPASTTGLLALPASGAQPPVSVSQQDGFDRTPGASRPRRPADRFGAPFVSFMPCGSSLVFPAPTEAAWPLHSPWIDQSILRDFDEPTRAAIDAGFEALGRIFSGIPQTREAIPFGQFPAAATNPAPDAVASPATVQIPSVLTESGETSYSLPGASLEGSSGFFSRS